VPLRHANMPWPPVVACTLHALIRQVLGKWTYHALAKPELGNHRGKSGDLELTEIERRRVQVYAVVSLASWHVKCTTVNSRCASHVSSMH
jgi:hypothetical protein